MTREEPQQSLETIFSLPISEIASEAQNTLHNVINLAKEIFSVHLNQTIFIYSSLDHQRFHIRKCRGWFNIDLGNEKKGIHCKFKAIKVDCSKTFRIIERNSTAESKSRSRNHSKTRRNSKSKLIYLESE